MAYYRIQAYEAEALLDGPQLSYSWNDMGDDERARAGKSVCGSREELAEYLAQVGIPFEDHWILVELEGTPSEDEDEDAHLGATLIHPTKIISTETIGESFIMEIMDAYENLAA